MRAVKRRARGLNAVNGGLDDSVLFGMNRAAFFMHRSRRNVLLLADTADVKAMRQSAGSAVVSRRQNTIVTNDNGADFISKARGALGNGGCDFDKIFIRRQSFAVQALIRHKKKKKTKIYKLLEN